MPHNHSHGDENMSDRRLVWSLVLNLLLTIVEIVAGAFAGSLALVADAIHNLSDCGSFMIALIARRIGRWMIAARSVTGEPKSSAPSSISRYW